MRFRAAAPTLRFEVFAAAVFGAALTASGAVLDSLSAAQRFLAASAILFRPAALIRRLRGAAGSAPSVAGSG